MIKKIIFTALTLWTFSFVLYSQNFIQHQHDESCYKKSDLEKYKSFLPAIKKQYTENKGLRNSMPGGQPAKVFITIFSDAGGINQAVPVSQALQDFENSKSIFDNAGICLILVGIREVEDGDLNNHDKIDEEAELDPYRNVNCLNIFYHRILHRNGLTIGGTAYTIISDKLSLSGTDYNESTFSHELGHCLGLIHTHERINNNAEHAARTGPCKDCDDEGDGLCDTPADPYFSQPYLGNFVNGSCNYTVTDFNYCSDNNTNYPWQPSPTNMMSYSISSCRSVFSNEQIAIMSDRLITEPILQAVYAPVSVVHVTPYSQSSGLYNFVTRDHFEFNSPSVNITSTSELFIKSKNIQVKNNAVFSPSSSGVVILSPTFMCD